MRSNAERLIALRFVKDPAGIWTRPDGYVIEFRNERAYRYDSQGNPRFGEPTFQITHWRLRKRGELTATLRAPNLQALIKLMEQRPEFAPPKETT